MKSFKEYLEEARYEDWNYDLPKNKKFESDKNNIYYAQKVLRDVPKELIDDVKASLEKDGKLPKGKEFNDVYKAMFVMNHAADVKNLSALKDKEIATKQDDFKELVDKVGLDSEQVLKTGNELADKEIKEKKTSKKDDSEEEPKDDEKESGSDKPKDDEKESGSDETDTDSEDDSESDEGKPNDDTSSDSGEKKTDGDTKSEKKSEERTVDSKSSEEMENTVKDTVGKFQEQIDNYKEKDDRSRVGRVSKIQKNYQTKANKLLDSIRKKEGRLSDPKLPYDWKVNAKRDIKKAKAELEAETRNAQADLVKNSTRTGVEKASKGIKDAVSKAKETGKKIADSKAGHTVGKAAQNTAQGMKQAVDKAKETADKIKKSSTGQAAEEKIKQAQQKVKSGLKKADTAVGDVISKGKESETYKKGRDAMSSLSKKVGSKVQQAKTGIQNTRGKLTQAGKAMKAGVEAADQTLKSGMTAEQKKKADEAAKKAREKAMVKTPAEKEKEEEKKKKAV